MPDCRRRRRPLPSQGQGAPAPSRSSCGWIPHPHHPGRGSGFPLSIRGGQEPEEGRRPGWRAAERSQSPAFLRHLQDFCVCVCVCVGGGRFVCGCRFFPVLSPAPCPNAPRSWVEGLQNPWATAACKKKKSLSTFASRGKEVRLLARVALRGMVLLGYGPTAARHLYRRGGICGEKRPTERRRALPASVYSRLKQPEGSPLERREGTGVGVLEERGSRDAEGGWRRCGGRIRI